MTAALLASRVSLKFIILIVVVVVTSGQRRTIRIIGEIETINKAKTLLRVGAWSGIIGAISWQFDEIFCSNLDI